MLEKGGVVIYPSASSYGIGCDATNATAAERVREIKGRSASKGMLVLVSDLKMAKTYGIIDHYAESLCKRYMPGPLTLIVPKHGRKIPDEVNKDFAFRIAVHPLAAKLVCAFGKPIVSTSANLSGNAPIYSIAEVRRQFANKVDLILDAGDLPETEPSTIVDVKNRKIIRKGQLDITL